MRRLFLVFAACTAFAVPVSLTALATATPAWAAGSSVTCAKFTVSSSGTVAAKSCSPTSGTWNKTQKKEWKELSGSTSALSNGGTLTWTNGGTITISKPTLTPGTKCTPSTKLTTDEVATGTVTTTSGGNQPANAGDAFSAEVCLYSNGKIKQATGVPALF